MQNRKAVHGASVLAHIEKHRAKGETEAVAAHMKSPLHRSIVDAAEAATHTATLSVGGENVPFTDLTAKDEDGGEGQE